MFTNIPLNETIDIAVDLIFTSKPDLKITRNDLKQLFMFATSKTCFLFNGDYYDQIDGVAMGSPLGPVLANLFMGFYEGKWLESYPSRGPSYYRRYVDDIFAVFDSKDDAFSFFDYLNSRHPNITFTIECENDHSLPFLDVNVSFKDGFLVSSVYRKPTFTGLMMNYFSFVPSCYKNGLVRTLIDRAFKINNQWSFFHKDLKRLRSILCRNLFPPKQIDKLIMTYINNTFSEKTKKATENTDCRYFKLPFIGKYSSVSKNKVRLLVEKFCKNINVKLIFSTCKISEYFSTKDKVPNHLLSMVVYKFVCANCNVCYVGETTRHLTTRVKEHLQSDKSSHVYKHLKSSTECKNTCTEACFSILDFAPSPYSLKLKEALHISLLKPALNKQVFNFGVTFTL